MADGSTELLTGWGRTAPTAAHVVAPADPEAVEQLLAHPGRRGVVARGLGRSYGDAAQNSGGTVLRLRPEGTVTVDPETASALVPAGLSLHEVLRQVLPQGYYVPVTPGTRYVTVGGAVA